MNNNLTCVTILLNPQSSVVLVARHGILARELGHPGPELLAPGPHLGVRVQHLLEVVLCSAPSVSQSAFTIMEKAPTRVRGL